MTTRSARYDQLGPVHIPLVQKHFGQPRVHNQYNREAWGTALQESGYEQAENNIHRRGELKSEFNVVKDHWLPFESSLAVRVPRFSLHFISSFTSSPQREHTLRYLNKKRHISACRPLFLLLPASFPPPLLSLR